MDPLAPVTARVILRLRLGGSDSDWRVTLLIIADWSYPSTMLAACETRTTDFTGT